MSTTTTTTHPDAVEVHNFRPTISVYTDRDNRVVSVEVVLSDIYEESYFADTGLPVHGSSTSAEDAADQLDAILGGPAQDVPTRLRLLADALATSQYEKNLG